MVLFRRLCERPFASNQEKFDAAEIISFYICRQLKTRLQGAVVFAASFSVHVKRRVICALLGGEGTLVTRGSFTYMSYELDDFRAPYFGPGWIEFVAPTGDGMRVKFPILFRCFISKSPESAVFKDGQYEVTLQL